MPHPSAVPALTPHNGTLSSQCQDFSTSRVISNGADLRQTPHVFCLVCLFTSQRDQHSGKATIWSATHLLEGCLSEHRLGAEGRGCCSMGRLTGHHGAVGVHAWGLRRGVWCAWAEAAPCPAMQTPLSHVRLGADLVRVMPRSCLNVQIAWHGRTQSNRCVHLTGLSEAYPTSLPSASTS